MFKERPRQLATLSKARRSDQRVQTSDILTVVKPSISKLGLGKV